MKIAPDYPVLIAIRDGKGLLPIQSCQSFYTQKQLGRHRDRGISACLLTQLYKKNTPVVTSASFFASPFLARKGPRIPTSVVPTCLKEKREIFHQEDKLTCIIQPPHQNRGRGLEEQSSNRVSRAGFTYVVCCGGSGSPQAQPMHSQAKR